MIPEEMVSCLALTKGWNLRRPRKPPARHQPQRPAAKAKSSSAPQEDALPLAPRGRVLLFRQPDPNYERRSASARSLSAPPGESRFVRKFLAAASQTAAATTRTVFRLMPIAKALRRSAPARECGQVPPGHGRHDTEDLPRSE